MNNDDDDDVTTKVYKIKASETKSGERKRWTGDKNTQWYSFFTAVAVIIQRGDLIE